MTTPLPRIGPPYTGRHRADTIARNVGGEHAVGHLSRGCVRCGVREMSTSDGEWISSVPPCTGRHRTGHREGGLRDQPPYTDDAR